MPRKLEISKHAKSAGRKFGRELKGFAKKTLRTAGRAAHNYVNSGGLTRDVSLIGGSGAGAAVRAFTGRGDYKVVRGRGFSEHGEMSDHKSKKSRTPQFSLEKGEMVISHSEYIGELVTGTVGGFVSQTYGINPGNYGTFPWLSSVANNFQDYELEKCIFEYKPLTSEALSSSTASVVSMGSVIMSTQYDSLSGAFPNKAQMENSDFAVSCKPSEHCQMAIECNPRFNPLGVLYVSPNLGVSSQTNGDIRMQNLGIFQIASQGVPTNGVAVDLGEIWVHYKIRLMKPQLGSNLGALLSAHYTSNASTGSPTTGNPWGNLALGVQPSPATNTILPLVFSTTSFAFPLAVTQGSYLCIYTIYGTSSTVGSMLPTVLNGTGTLLQVWSTNSIADGATSSTAPQAGVTLCFVQTCCFIVSVNAPGSILCAINMAITNPPASGRFDLFVTPYNSLITT